MKRRTGGNILKLVLRLPEAQRWGNLGILDIQNFYLLENPLKDLIHFTRKGCFCCAMQENSHLFFVWKNYLGERFGKKAMEWDHRDREPCLSPAAFVNQVQYSNILEGRFKQLQGKSHTDLFIWLKGKFYSIWELVIYFYPSVTL